MNEYKLSNIKIGLKESFSVVIDSSKLDKFLDISNDLNPLHVDNAYAKEKGFDGRVVYGLLTASFYSTLVGVHLPGKYCILQSIDTQFLKPVYIGETLTISGNPKRVRLWRPDWGHGKVVTIPFPLPNFKGINFRIRENHWQNFVPVSRVFKSFLELADESRRYLL